MHTCVRDSGFVRGDVANVLENGSVINYIIHIIYIYIYVLRSGGPSLKSSAHYPSGFAAFIADQHAKLLAPWNLILYTHHALRF